MTAVMTTLSPGIEPILTVKLQNVKNRSVIKYNIDRNYLYFIRVSSIADTIEGYAGKQVSNGVFTVRGVI